MLLPLVATVVLSLVAAGAQKLPWLVASLLVRPVTAELLSLSRAIPASTRRDVGIRSRSLPVPVVGEHEKSSRREPRFGESPDIAKDALGTPCPCSPPLQAKQRWGPVAPLCCPHTVVSAGVQHRGLAGCECGLCARETSWHRASGEQNHDLWVPVASEACGNLPLGKSGKGKRLWLTCFSLELTSLSGTGVCGFLKLFH